MQQYYPRLRQDGAEVIALSMDDLQGAATMLANSGATFPVVYTNRRENIPEAYGVYDLHNDGVAAPAVFIIDKSGEIVYRYVGDTIADRPPTSEILAELRSLPN